MSNAYNKFKFLCTILLLVLVTSSAYAVQYEITDIGIPSDGWATDGRRINNNGQVAVYATDSIGTLHAYKWENGVLSSIVTVAGENLSYSRAINELGEITGQLRVDGDTSGHMYIYHPDTGQMEDLGSLGSGSTSTMDINNHQQMVGNYVDNGKVYAFLYDYNTGTTTTIFTSEDIGYSFGKAINDSGHIVAFAGADTSSRHAYFISYDAATPYLEDLGTFGGDESQAFDINESDYIVGFSQTALNNYMHAFICTGFENGSINPMEDLGTLGGNESWAWGLNAQAQVVGWADTDSGESHAFLWDTDSEMQDLNDLVIDLGKWDYLEIANDINDYGQIVGYGYIDGVKHAFILNPITPIPEPATIFLLIAGLVQLLIKKFTRE